MKIKITLLGLLITSSMVSHSYADSNEKGVIEEVREDIRDWLLEEEETSEKISEENKKQIKAIIAEEIKESQNAGIKFSGKIAMSPNVVYQDKAWKTGNAVKANLAAKREVPATLCGKNAALALGLKLTPKEVKFLEATATVAKFLTVGYGSSIFGYEKTNPGLSISPSASVMQIKFQHSFDCFKLAYAIEAPKELKLGLFDKTQMVEENDTDDVKKTKSKINKIDNPKEEKKAFNVKGDIPALGISLGIVNDACNISLSGLGRFSNYTHTADPKAKKTDTDNDSLLTWGANLGAQYKIVPDQWTLTGEGFYVSGLGDYIMGLDDIQGNEKRQEMCSVYYKDKTKKDLTKINAFGAGGTLEVAVTPKWTFSLSGSYLKALEDADKPASALQSKWHGGPDLTYKVNEHLSISSGYRAFKEHKIDAIQGKEKGIEHKGSGGIKFSF